VAQYTPTAAANLLRAPGNLPERVEVALIQYAASRYAADAAVGGTDWSYSRRLATNPIGEANSVVPLLVSLVNVAVPGTEEAPTAPVDSELATAVAGLWNFLAGSA
jgi:hypothetical protein